MREVLHCGVFLLSVVDLISILEQFLLENTTSSFVSKEKEKKTLFLEIIYSKLTCQIVFLLT